MKGRGEGMTLRMAIPNKGRLNERTVELLMKSGLDLGEDWGRRLYISVKNQDLEVVFVRAQDVPELINTGAVDFGITGWDQVAESGYKMQKLLDLEFGYCRLSVAVPEKLGMKNPSEIPDGCKVATSFPKLAKSYFERIGKKAKIIQVSGAAEIMPYMGVSDIIVDLVSSGSTLKMNRLTELDVIVESQAVAVCGKLAADKKEAVTDILDSIRSVIEAEKKIYLMADVPVKNLRAVEKACPGIEGPTIMNIAGRDDMVAIHVVINKCDVFDSVNKLKKLGGKGILILPINRLVA
ncbi:MAG: ATP phosphoribosyltransferase [Candidatus Methanomethylophilaceae archaeon]|nr:ATP phosphoribosyltransferase [Candidatus Methanomethylophilaceae archaeon]